MQRLRFADFSDEAHRLHMHVTRLADRQRSSAHSHDFYELFLVMTGGGIHHLNGDNVPLRAGDMVALRPTDQHCFTSQGGEGLAFVNIAVSAAWWAASRTLLGLPEWDAERRSATLDPADTRSLGADLRRITLGDDPIAVLAVWKRVNDRLTGTAKPAAATPPVWLDSLRQDLAARPQSLGEPISFWQDRSGCSAEHLSRSCRRFYGMTFRDVINHARVERAKYLLRTTDRKVITVAHDCGFNNLANFYRTFARRCGVSPHRWRLAGSAAVPTSDAKSEAEPSH